MGVSEESSQDQCIWWHTKTVESTESSLRTSITTGLDHEEVVSRQQIHGFNELSADSGPKWIKVLLRQFIDAMNWIFLIFAAASYALNDYATGTMLVVITLLNLYLSFSQEYAAEQTLAALRSLSSPMAHVIRGGNELQIESRELVPGDILLIKEGDSVAADVRLTYVSNLEADEALLTGESVPVAKTLAAFETKGKLKTHCAFWDFYLRLSHSSLFFFFYFFLLTTQKMYLLAIGPMLPTALLSSRKVVVKVSSLRQACILKSAKWQQNSMKRAMVIRRNSKSHSTKCTLL